MLLHALSDVKIMEASVGSRVWESSAALCCSHRSCSHHLLLCFHYFNKVILRHVFHFRASATNPHFSLGTIKFWAKLKLPVPAWVSFCVCLSSQASLFIMRGQISSSIRQSNVPVSKDKNAKETRVSQTRSWHVEANNVLCRGKHWDRNKTPSDLSPWCSTCSSVSRFQSAATGSTLVNNGSVLSRFPSLPMLFKD